jgi:probable F420-dependent oxidoreductase
MIDAPVEVGIGTGPLASRDICTIALRAEELGFESIWVPEHLVIPRESTGTPRHHGKDSQLDPSNPLVDPFVALAFIAAQTTHIHVGTGVFNVALRHPFVVSRAAGTLADVAPGRVEIGVGSSWLASEYDAVGLDFASRGQRLDEALAIITATWTDTLVEYHGNHFDFKPVYWEAKPAVRPRFHIAGEVEASFRRVARYGDGWIAMDHTPESIAPVVKRMREAVANHNVEASGLQVSLSVNATEYSGHAADLLERLAAAGVTRAILGGIMPLEEKLRAMENIATELSG